MNEYQTVQEFYKNICYFQHLPMRVMIDGILYEKNYAINRKIEYYSNNERHLIQFELNQDHSPFNFKAQYIIKSNCANSLNEKYDIL